MTLRSMRRAQERKAMKASRKQAQQEVSPAQLTANQTNAQLSTGPRTEAGKAKVALNAVKTALTGRTILLPGDDAAQYERHIQSYLDELSPVGQRECDLVQSIADTWWRLARIPILESALLAKGYRDSAEQFEDEAPEVQPALIATEAFLKYEKQIRNLHLQESRLYRRYEKDRAELRQLQQDRRQKEEAQQAATTTHQPTEKEIAAMFPGCDISHDGFEFSQPEIDAQIARLQAHYNAAPNTHTAAEAA